MTFGKEETRCHTDIEEVEDLGNLIAEDLLLTKIWEGAEGVGMSFSVASQANEGMTVFEFSRRVS